MEATTNSSAAEQHTKLQLELETDTEAETEAEAPTRTATTATIIDIPAAAAASCHISCSAFSSSYDTDCSTASSTCCTRQGEQIYMQRDTALHKSSAAAAAAATQSVTVSAPAAVTATAATTNASPSPMVCNLQQLGADADEVAMLKFEHRKHWPWFILLISVIEVSFEVHSTRSLFQFYPFTSNSIPKHSLFQFHTF